MHSHRPGDRYVICDRTGFRVRAADACKEWNGAVVSKRVYEARHPLDYFRPPRPDDPRVQDPRPRPTDIFAYPAGGPFFLVATPAADASIEVTGGMFRAYRGVTVSAAEFPKSF